jgi:hypothetical protein
MSRFYAFDFYEGDTFSYFFYTKYEVIYEVRFKPTPYLFENKAEIANSVYELIIAPISVPTRSKIPQIQQYRLPSQQFVKTFLIGIRNEFCCTCAKRQIFIIEREPRSLMVGSGSSTITIF